jgi:hypothetical protein
VYVGFSDTDFGSVFPLQNYPSASHLAPLRLRIFLGEDYPQMARNQVRNLAERRIRAVTFIARR